MAQIGAEIIFSIHSNVVERPLRLACLFIFGGNGLNSGIMTISVLFTLDKVQVLL